MPEVSLVHVDVAIQQHLSTSRDLERLRVATILILVPVESGAAFTPIVSTTAATGVIGPTCRFGPTPTKSLVESERGLLEGTPTWRSSGTATSLSDRTRQRSDSALDWLRWHF